MHRNRGVLGQRVEAHKQTDLQTKFERSRHIAFEAEKDELRHLKQHFDLKLEGDFEE